VDSNATKIELVNVCIDVSLIKILIPAVLADMPLSSHPDCEDQSKGGRQVHCKDCIAKEGGGEEAPKGFKVDKTAAVGGGNGKGGKVINRGAVVNVLDGRDNLLD
jgi:hypothetical protein